MTMPEYLARTKATRKPWPELGRNEFLEYLQNLLEYAIKNAQMSESEATELYLSYEEYLFGREVDEYNPITGEIETTFQETEGMYRDPSKLPVYKILQQFSPSVMKERKGKEAEYTQYLKDFKAYEVERTKLEERKEHLDYQRNLQRQYGRFISQEREDWEKAGRGGELPKMPSVEDVAFPFLEQIPEHMKGYFPLGKLWEKFTKEQPGARAGWWARMHEEDEDREPNIQAQKYAEKWGITPEQAASLGWRYREGADRGEFSTLTKEQLRGLGQVGTAGGARAIGGADPWASFLQNYPFLSEFMELPPRRRGFYPSLYSPPTRWL